MAQELAIFLAVVIGAIWLVGKILVAIGNSVDQSMKRPGRRPQKEKRSVSLKSEPISLDPTAASEPVAASSLPSRVDAWTREICTNSELSDYESAG